MVKRILFLFLGLLLLTGTAFAELPDFASMTFEELSAMKTALDQEYASRPESEGVFLDKGSFVVGRDLKPGTYYAAMVKPLSYSSNTYVEIRNARKITTLQTYFNFGEEPARIALEEDSVITVSGGSLFIKASPYSISDYYNYDPPKGTVVPIGKYKVGEDIPAGTYNLYPESITGGEYKIYTTKTNDDGTTELVPKDGYRSSTGLYIKSDSEYKVERLDEGDVVDIIKSVIFVKPQKLVFD